MEKEFKLISMTDFVIQQRSELLFKELGKACCKYTDFLKQPLKLEMFVPRDEDWNVLEKPMYFDKYENGERQNSSWENWGNECKQYQQAKEKVLFEDKINMPKNNSEFSNWIDYSKFKLVEDIIEYDLQLTESAIKQIFG